MESKLGGAELFNSHDKACSLSIERFNCSDGEKVHITWTQDMQVNPKKLNNSSQSLEFTEKLKKAFAPEFRKEDQVFPMIRLPITMKLIIAPNSDQDSKNRAQLLVFGELLEKVVLHCNTSTRLRLAFTFSNHVHLAYGRIYVPIYSHQSADFHIYHDMLPEIKGVNREVTGYCLQTFLPFLHISQLWGNDLDNYWDIHFRGMLLDGESGDNIVLENMLTSLLNDVTLVASNQRQIQASKLLLAGRSNVFKKAFECGWKENESDRYEMTESPEAITAFLAYIYSNKVDTNMVEANSSIAFEVLEMAHKYDVSPLEKAMFEILRKKHFSWIGVKIAVKLFGFARNVVDYESLKHKAVRVINRATPLQLKESAEFNSFFNEDHIAASELCRLMHEFNVA